MSQRGGSVSKFPGRTLPHRQTVKNALSGGRRGGGSYNDRRDDWSASLDESGAKPDLRVSSGRQVQRPSETSRLSGFSWFSDSFSRNEAT